MVNAYITRWKVEETIRFIKQSYDFEDVRVLTYDRLKNMAVLVLGAAYFAAVSALGTRTKLNKMSPEFREFRGHPTSGHRHGAGWKRIPKKACLR